MTQTGYNWLTNLIDRQSQWFKEALNTLIEYLTGSNDHSADMCNPFFYPLASIIAIGMFFSASITTLVGWPCAMIKDIQHFPHDSLAAISSLLLVTPAYVIFMTIFKLLATVLAFVGFLLSCVIILLASIFFLLKYIVEKITSSCGNAIGFCIKSASRN